MRNDLNFSPFPNLSTERLLLRKPDISDIFEIEKIRSNEIVNKYIDRPKTVTLADVHEFLTKINDNIRKSETVYWAIVPKSNFILVGTICLWNFSKINDCVEIGFELHPDFHNKGIMQEAIKPVIDFAFNTIQCKHVEAFTRGDNHASIKLLLKQGFYPHSRSENENGDIIYRLDYLQNNNGFKLTN